MVEENRVAVKQIKSKGSQISSDIEERLCVLELQLRLRRNNSQEKILEVPVLKSPTIT